MRSRRFDFTVTCVCTALLGYFGWHASKGPRGYAFRDRLVAQAASLGDKYAALEKQRLLRENKVALLRPESIDPDLLDELARAQLEMAAPGDVVVMEQSEIPQENP
ncbi:MAG: FtsB family cell division protein [Aestuariivirga sp.]